MKKKGNKNNVTLKSKSNMSWNSWKTDNALYGPMLSSPLWLDNWACLDLCEKDTLHDKRSVQKGKKLNFCMNININTACKKKNNIFPVNITVLIYAMYTMRLKPYIERDIRHYNDHIRFQRSWHQNEFAVEQNWQEDRYCKIGIVYSYILIVHMIWIFNKIASLRRF